MTAAERIAFQESHAEDYHSMAFLSNAIIFALGVISLGALIYLT